jgi:O-antigen/teichoic acid export membrane protein
VIRVFDRFRLSFAVGSAAPVIRVSAVALAVGLGAGIPGIIWARVGAEALGTVIAALAALSVLRRHLWEHRRAPVRLLAPQAREIRKFLINTNLAGIVRAASTKLDVVLVGALANPSVVSLYKVSIQFGTAPLLISDALFTSVFPSFARALPTGRVGAMRDIARHTSRLLASVVIPATALFAFVGGPALGLILGDHYSHAALPTLLCLLGVGAFVVFYWVQPLLLTAGEAGMLLRIGALGAVLQFIVLALLVPHFNAAGATAALGGMYLFVTVVTLEWIRRRGLLEGAEGRVPTGPAEAVDVPIGAPQDVGRIRTPTAPGDPM